MVAGFRVKKIEEVNQLGQRIREARERLYYDISLVSRELNISELHLHWLEEGAFDKLPPAVYVKGYLKKLAGFLKLPQVELLSLYVDEAGIEAQHVRAERKALAKVRSRNSQFWVDLLTPRFIKVALAVVALLIAGAYVWTQVSVFAKEPALQVTTPPADMTVTSQELAIAGVTDPESTVTINGQNVGIDRGGSFMEQVTLQSGINTINVKAVNKFGHEAQITRQILLQNHITSR